LLHLQLLDCVLYWLLHLHLSRGQLLPPLQNPQLLLQPESLVRLLLLLRCTLLVSVRFEWLDIQLLLLLVLLLHPQVLLQQRSG
jgi:hypothetical protein